MGRTLIEKSGVFFLSNNEVDDDVDNDVDDVDNDVDDVDDDVDNGVDNVVGGLE